MPPEKAAGSEWEKYSIFGFHRYPLRGVAVIHAIYYITCHGYGHGVRSAAICNAFSRNVTITFRTVLPEQFFREEVRRDFSYAPERYDCGCFQRDGITTDIEKTLSTYRTIAARNRAALDDEARWCEQQNADVIISDIPPFAFAVARRCGIPSAAVTNFTWFDIYSPYARLFPDFTPVLDEMKQQYSLADMVLALEPALPMNYFKCSKTVPPVGRNGRNRRKEIIDRYRIDPDKHIGLIYIGEFGLDGIDWRTLAAFIEWEFLGIYPLAGSPANYHLVSKDVFPYQDLLASVDCMVGKVGYGAVAECMLHGIPIVYLPRDDFAEYTALDSAVRAWGGGYPLSLEAFLEADWGPTLKTIVARGSLMPLPANGVRLCAAEIEKLAASGY